MADNPYRAGVDRFAALLAEGAAIGTGPSSARPPQQGGCTALIFAPHLDY